jgi:hypothetical protein
MSPDNRDASLFDRLAPGRWEEIVVCAGCERRLAEPKKARRAFIGTRRGGFALCRLCRRCARQVARGGPLRERLLGEATQTIDLLLGEPAGQA